MSNETVSFDLDELRHLAWSATVPHDGDYEAAARERIAWLEKASPENWHSFALAFNWDDPLDPLEWIVRQDECDMATALTIFWRSVPGWDLMCHAEGDTSYKRPESDLIEYIAKRIAAKGYKRRKIAWDPEPIMRNGYKEMQAHVATIANPPWTPHPDMLRPLRGREVVDSFQEWEARPEGVRTGFWINLPPSDIVTPNMVEARDQLATALFYLFCVGAGIPMALIFMKDPIQHWLPLMALAGFMAWWIHDIQRSSSLVRSLIRENQTPVPKRHGMMLYASICLSGTLTFLAFDNLLGSGQRAAMMSPKGLIDLGLIGAAGFVIWYGLGKLSQLISYRYLFR